MSKMSFTTRLGHIFLSIIEAIVIALVYVWRVARKPDVHGDLRFGISTMLSSAKRDGCITIERRDGEQVFPLNEEDGSEASIIDAVISRLRLDGYVIDDRDAAEIRAHLKAMLDLPDKHLADAYTFNFSDLVASVKVYKNLTTDPGCHADSCAGCETPCTWNGDWYIDATSPMGERDTFGSYLEEADAREAMKRLQKKGYADFNGPYQS